ncbi:hypothetical protein BDV96DRAFT_648946 [Lophiotrema nucula]|uniref:MYND-type domain-containing protein n=1 Tax=Lophiotrema nucula TaxID=690887 RepID=A0A6A5YZW1_9PLEO|nr:hypothetical protein BDV96DRAFT_648946 [Lophiotrema nucula]
MANQCATCSRTSTPDGIPLMRCARYKSTYYCDRECQRADFQSHKFRCEVIAMIQDMPAGTLPPGTEIQLGATTSVGDVMKYSPENIKDQFILRDVASIALAKLPSTAFYLNILRPWLEDSDANKDVHLGPMLDREARTQVADVFLKHSSFFEDSFEKTLALVGGFHAIEEMKVPGGNRLCGKTMTVNQSTKEQILVHMPDLWKEDYRIDRRDI